MGSYHYASFSIPLVLQQMLSAQNLRSCQSFISSQPLSKSHQSLMFQTFESSHRPTQLTPAWVPMELVELVAEDSLMSPEEFIATYADVEAYTSCDDEGDDLHQCDFFSQFLGPTKWLHLTPQAHETVDRIHFDIWKDAWSHPRGMVDVADKVSTETLRYYDEYSHDQQVSSAIFLEEESPKPLIRIKVIPASFGLEGFQQAVWEAMEDLTAHSVIVSRKRMSGSKAAYGTPLVSSRKVVIFVVASPDLSDPLLMEDGKISSQAEFASDNFRDFALDVMEKLALLTGIEEDSLEIEMTAFHPFWKKSIPEQESECKASFPYPCIALFTEVKCLI